MKEHNDNEKDGENNHPTKQQQAEQQHENKTPTNKLHLVLAATDNNKIQKRHNQIRNTQTRPYGAKTIQKHWQKTKHNGNKNLFGDCLT